MSKIIQKIKTGTSLLPNITANMGFTYSCLN